MTVAKSARERLRWDRVQELLRLLVSAIEPIARLIDAISRFR